jgi:hypothetical protein
MKKRVSEKNDFTTIMSSTAWRKAVEAMHK